VPGNLEDIFAAFRPIDEMASACRSRLAVTSSWTGDNEKSVVKLPLLPINPDPGPDRPQNRREL
jgi:hypothetical protein